MNTRRALLKKVVDRCKRWRQCPFCGAAQGAVKRAGSLLKIVHDKYVKNATLMESFLQEFDEAVKHNDALRAHFGKAQEDLNPVRVLSLFEAILKEDVDLLDLHDRCGFEHRIRTQHVRVCSVLCLRRTGRCVVSTGESD